MPDFEFIDADDSRWLSLLQTIPHDFYHRPEYAVLSAKHETGYPCAFWARDRGTEILLPLVLKPVTAEVAGRSVCYDAISPYGYPGPIIGQGDETGSSIATLLESFHTLGRDKGVVTAFIRLHPLLNPNHDDSQYSAFGTVVDHGQTVYVDLSQTLESIGAQIRKSHRYEIRRLQKQGYTIECENAVRLPQFIELYYETMERVGAGRQYYFPSSYFYDLRNCLNSDLTLCCAMAPNGDLASASYFTHCGGIVQYHLSATAEAHRRMSPGKLIIDYIIRWSKARGCHTLHLGGGYGLGTDALLKFKAGFTHHRASYRSWRTVLDADLYDRLVASAAAIGVGDRGYFPPYRALGMPDLMHHDRAAG